MSPSPQPNLTLDPQGFRGTHTARRLRKTRRKRQLQTLFVALLLLMCAAALGWYFLQPRATGFAVARAQIFPLDLSAPAMLDGNGNLWLTSASGALWRIDADGQSQSYDYVMASRAGAPPLVSTADVKVGGVYVAGLDGRLWAFDGGDKTLWNRDLGSSFATTPAHLRLGNLRILGVGDSEGRVAGLNASNGKTLWSAQLGGPIGNAIVATRDGLLAPTLASGVWRGGLVLLDARSGRVKWRFPTDNRIAAGIAAPLFDSANNRVYWNNDEGDAVCLDAKSGRVIWQSSVASLQADAPLAVVLRATPLLFGESLIVGGNDGALRSLHVRDGKVRWTRRLGAPIRALGAANVGGAPAILTVSGREIVLLSAAKGEVIGSDVGEMAWPVPGGQGAIIVGDGGSWRRVSW